MKATIEQKSKLSKYVVMPLNKSILCISLAFIYLLNAFLQAPSLDIILSVICLLLVTVCFPTVKGNTRIVITLLFLIGAALLILTNANIELWLNAISKNTNFVVLLILVPIFGLPLNYGGYYTDLDIMVSKYMNTKHRIYWLPALLSHFFGSLMNMGAIPIVFQLIIHGKLPLSLLSVPSAILRGFISSIYWSPNMVSVALVTHYLNISWAEFVRVGIFFTLLSLLVGWLSHIYSLRKSDLQLTPKILEANLEINKRKVTELVFFCAVFLGLIIFIAVKTTFPVLKAVPLLALMYPIFWLISIGKGNVIFGAYRDYLTNSLPRFTSEIVMFLGAGFVASALISTGNDEKISLLLLDFIGLNAYLLCFFILSSIVLLSLVGITPMVTVMAYSAALKPELIGITPQLLALVLVGGWAIGALVSPFTGVTLIMSGLTQKSSFEIARANWLYGFIMVLLFSTIPFLQRLL